eukprot:284816734_4
MGLVLTNCGSPTPNTTPTPRGRFPITSSSTKYLCDCRIVRPASNFSTCARLLITWRDSSSTWIFPLLRANHSQVSGSSTLTSFSRPFSRTAPVTASPLRSAGQSFKSASDCAITTRPLSRAAPRASSAGLLMWYFNSSNTATIGLGFFEPLLSRRSAIISRTSNIRCMRTTFAFLIEPTTYTAPPSSTTFDRLRPFTAFTELSSAISRKSPAKAAFFSRTTPHSLYNLAGVYPPSPAISAQSFAAFLSAILKSSAPPLSERPKPAKNNSSISSLLAPSKKFIGPAPGRKSTWSTPAVTAASTTAPHSSSLGSIANNAAPWVTAWASIIPMNTPLPDPVVPATTCGNALFQYTGSPDSPRPKKYLPFWKYFFGSYSSCCFGKNCSILLTSTFLFRSRLVLTVNLCNSSSNFGVNLRINAIEVTSAPKNRRNHTNKCHPGNPGSPFLSATMFTMNQAPGPKKESPALKARKTLLCIFSSVLSPTARNAPESNEPIKTAISSIIRALTAFMTISKLILYPVHVSDNSSPHASRQSEHPLRKSLGTRSQPAKRVTAAQQLTPVEDGSHAALRLTAAPAAHDPRSGSLLPGRQRRPGWGPRRRTWVEPATRAKIGRRGVPIAPGLPRSMGPTARGGSRPPKPCQAPQRGGPVQGPCAKRMRLGLGPPQRAGGGWGGRTAPACG